MKKIFLIGLLTALSWVGYSSVTIWTLLDAPKSDFGRLELTDRKGQILTDLPKSSGYSIPFEGAIDSPLVDAIIEVEDQRFFTHFGSDIVGKVGALRENIAAKKVVRGGSTITEQYIKNTYFPRVERTIPQKIREMTWALVMEMKYSKEEILKRYLGTVYMGNGLYGIPAALEAYFPEKNIENLSQGEIIEILTRIKYPNVTEGSSAYQKRIAEKLSYTGALEPIEKRKKKSTLDTFPFLTERIKNEIALSCSGRENHLIDFVMKIPSDLCTKSDTILVTSIDLALSDYAVKVLEGTLYPLESKNVHNGSVYIWSEKEKKVLAYIGNRANTKSNAVDMITRKRSVGSVLKPFVYELGLEAGWNPESLILDDTRVYETADTSKSYVPENYVPKPYGPITLREALGNSLNSATVRLSEKIGIGRIYERFRSIGFDLDHEAGYYGYGISLGSVELSLEDVVHGYRTLTDLGDQEKYFLFDMLSDSANRARTFGVSSILGTSIPLAVKTGTSTDFRDNWAIGYTPDIIIGVWVGNTDGESMDDISGVTGAGPIYHAIAEDMIAKGYITPVDMTPPSGIVSSLLCRDTGCYEKSMSFIRAGWTSKSRPKSGLYYREDFVTDITAEELRKWKIR